MSDFIKVMDNFHIKKWTIATKKHHEIEHVHDVTVVHLLRPSIMVDKVNIC